MAMIDHTVAVNVAALFMRRIGDALQYTKVEDIEVGALDVDPRAAIALPLHDYTAREVQVLALVGSPVSKAIGKRIMIEEASNGDQLDDDLVLMGPMKTVSRDPTTSKAKDKLKSKPKRK
ncbi:predicted protein [Postia placenta Mad-698-R]|uniref:Uncharacterized protein n=1 Tax=Postia placenta MAD-698-R-SB12 TaxID=670580 RepID=A0A1X6MHH2_9APHY|nr:hypothetical protein POSPLADRAFT_1162605 [Postia placenta MAD-698-R-SB12]EED84042.1 predicted protein [Postia placenta Mad-698-R]OSX55871.1 hypothetical protein POSPLADRAFT_1162605 [Postia placenta MAD-698-R-SB12]